MNQVVILHGWSDTSRSFGSLVEFLKAAGHSPVPIWLGDYVSMEDDVSVRDVARRMSVVLADLIATGKLTTPFDMIVHSTGGLVAREWIVSNYGEHPQDCPLKRLVMLAPANFGSRLASLGQSLLGRVVKGWNNWFHTGTTMLRELELASQYQWALAQRDLFVTGGGAAVPPALYGGDRTWPFVIIGTHPYTEALRRIVNEDGSDGTVRVPAANLNVRGVTIDFTANELMPEFNEWPLRNEAQVPFAVLPDQTHGSIINPEHPTIARTGRSQLGEMLLEALACPDIAAYSALFAKWAAVSESTCALGAPPAAGATARDAIFGPNNDKDADWFHQYLQVVVQVVDDYGADVDDYFLEFFSPTGDTKNDAAVYFHRHVIREVHVNGVRPSRRCIFADRTNLVTEYYDLIRGSGDKVVSLSLSATPPGNDVRYFKDLKKGAAGEIVVHREDANTAEGRWLKRNTTHFVKIVIPRVPADEVFKIKGV